MRTPLFGLLLVIGPVAAQDAAPDWTSSDGTVTVSVGGKLHADARVVDGDAASPFLVRRARAGVEVEVAERFRATFEPGFGEGDAELLAGWVEADLAGGLRLRAGKFKSPFGLESLRSSTDLRFAERALATALSPRRDVGVMAHVEAPRLEAALGLFNGVPDGASEDREPSDAKDVVARVLASPVEGVSVGLALATGAERGTSEVPALADYETSADHAFLAFRPGVVADGARQRVGPQATLARGRLQADAEWTWARHRVRGPDGPADLEHEAWQVAASVVLSGTPRGRKRPLPSRPAPDGGIGAVEVSARVHGFAADPATAPLATAGSARRALAWALAAHWTPIVPVRLGATVERTTFDGFEGEADPRAETALFVRAAFEL
ncbi:porin [Rubrivirga marina]|uniref:Porin domain-containing protein n=1 Tax=Rubrivirga marina TaxID=1196024 RepID=A0A271J427_9BACT|nr:porin [Rubrivirga marina]PAP77794.1 hypothetical protein BSZ37_15755 [Rubrivirga marina]